MAPRKQAEAPAKPKAEAKAAQPSDVPGGLYARAGGYVLRDGVWVLETDTSK